MRDGLTPRQVRALLFLVGWVIAIGIFVLFLLLGGAS